MVFYVVVDIVIDYDGFSDGDDGDDVWCMKEWIVDEWWVMEAVQWPNVLILWVPRQ